MPDPAFDHEPIELLQKLKAAGVILVPVHDDKSPVHQR